MEYIEINSLFLWCNIRTHSRIDKSSWNHYYVFILRTSLKKSKTETFDEVGRRDERLKERFWRKCAPQFEVGFSVLVSVIKEKYGKNKPALKIHTIAKESRCSHESSRDKYRHVWQIFISVLCTNDYIAEPNSGSSAWEEC